MLRRRLAADQAAAPDFDSAPLDEAGPTARAAPAPAAAIGPESSATRTLTPPGDPLLPWQWSVSGGVETRGINVQSVWTEYRGAGIKVAVVDDGFDYDHPDLTRNYDRALDQDTIQHDGDARLASGNWHGTTVMGVIGADDNGIGTVGVAPDATLVGLRIGYGASGSTSQLYEAFNFAKASDVVNNSWSYSGFFQDDFDRPWLAYVEDALIGAVSGGRGGLGTNVFFAAGNGRQQGDDVNHHNFQNSIYSTAVGAIDASGALAGFSTPGAAVHVVAPGIGILTTDAVSGGYVAGDTAWMNGTSFSSPTVAGVAALMLSANKGLGYRDVQEILAYSARLTDAGSATWKINHADTWNGGGLHGSSDYGFGLVNAHDAVRLAETWTLKSTYATMDKATAFAAPGQWLPTTGLVLSDLVVTRALEVDKIEVELRVDHSWIGDLRVSLVSPDGTESMLIDRPGVARGGGGDGSSEDGLYFTLSSNQFWGEDSVGTWRLKVEDVGTGGYGRLDSWRLNVYGDDATGNDQYVYTDEFALYGAADAARRVLVDTRGLDTVNGSALTTAMNFDLRSGGTIAGQQVTIQPGTFLERLYGGDSGDVLTGNSGANSIWGGRGNDVLAGGSGSDRFLFGRNSGADVVADFAAGDQIVLRDGIWCRSLSGALATLSDGATITAANGYLWKTTDFVFG